MRLTQLSPTQKVPDYHVRVNIDQKTKQIAEVEVSPSGVFYADIVEEVCLMLLCLLSSFFFASAFLSPFLSSFPPPRSHAFFYSFATHHALGAQSIHFQAIRTADIKFLVRELQCRIVNFQYLQAEIAELKKTFLQMRLDNNVFTIMVKEKIAAQMAIGVDYPHPHSRVTLLKMENTPKPIVDALKVSCCAIDAP